MTLNFGVNIYFLFLFFFSLWRIKGKLIALHQGHYEKIRHLQTHTDDLLKTFRKMWS